MKGTTGKSPCLGGTVEDGVGGIGLI